ncbi:hypothetical protein Nepgr_005642 [Nepenthes gracilis]|uniref:Uncharacterized protein n=1 Tax=Nepenthes gracilis TaxID=150966 RepID=A0AAD3S3K6_NEPGR|nr:hypothetical protein Nepgr_005642 [Nepenthes gracilis]
MGRSPCCSKVGLNRGAWTAMEDKILADYIKIHGEGKWRHIPIKAGLKRCGKSCRLRWLNYLKPDIKRGNITHDEEDLIIRLHKLLGNRWSLIAGRLPGRTDNEIKNYWNSNIVKKIVGHQSSISRPKSVNDYEQRKFNHSQALVSINPQQNAASAVRTKASRCNKLFIAQEMQKLEHKNDTESMIDELLMDMGTGNPPLVGPDLLDEQCKWVPDEYDSLDFLMDVKMNEQFLPRILEGGCFPSPELDNEAKGEAVGSEMNHSSSSFSNQCCFFSKGIRDESDDSWVVRFFE